MPVLECLPMHITVLYITSVTSLTLLLNLALVDANVIAENENQTREFYDLPAGFGPSFPEDGIKGLTVSSNPVHGCTPINKPPSKYIEPDFVWIAVIQRGGCVFDQKVLNAQKAGYGAAIIYNINGSSSLIPMGGDPFNKVNIPSCFVGNGDGRLLAKVFNYSSGYIVTIDNDIPFDGAYYLFPLAVVLGICFILMLVFMVVKWLRDVHKKRKSRLSKKQLNKIPTKKFTKGDAYDVCAVCLDDYEENQELRVLPCSHVYHMNCIDPWLLRNKPTCPICKRKVVKSLPDPESNQESDSDADEDTPLIRPGSSDTRTFGATSSSAGEPSTINYQDITDSDSDLSDYDEAPVVSTREDSPTDDVTNEPRDVIPEVEVIRKSGLPERTPEKTEEGEAAAAPADNGLPQSEGTAETEPAPQNDQETPKPETRKGASRTPSPKAPSKTPSPRATPSPRPAAPLEPQVVVEVPGGRHSINADREIDGVV